MTAATTPLIFDRGKRRKVLNGEFRELLEFKVLNTNNFERFESNLYNFLPKAIIFLNTNYANDSNTNMNFFFKTAIISN